MRKYPLVIVSMVLACSLAFNVGCQKHSVFEPIVDSGSGTEQIESNDYDSIDCSSSKIKASSYVSGCEPYKAFDGNTATYWQSQNSSPQWINVDLGKVMDFNQIKIFWGSSFARKFTINVSSDGVSWTTVHSGAATKYGWQVITLSATMKWARFIGVYCYDRSASWGNQIIEVKILNASYYSYYTDASGLKIVTNPSDISALVNKDRNLSSSYAPSDLVVPNVPFLVAEYMEKKNVRKEAALALEKLFAGAAANGYSLLAVSGYRSYATQTYLFNQNVLKYGSEEAANKVSARPGQSEHQTGLAMDISCMSQGGYLTEAFGETPEGKWLAENAHNYGFIIRFPLGKESITGYNYEPWHIRYVGVDHAKAVKTAGLTLEEYLYRIALK